ncbi:uncharacterized protein LOC119733752 [Patiria miniata]|uniref:Gag protein n=1 Tax=Patiria miniata TaxID=46514 RepID=A0A914AH55_PATMI|nr:uncharacterized protein LOC119733752 [Patiria miniata]
MANEDSHAQLPMERSTFLPPFSSHYDKDEDWDCYVERFELFLQAHGLDPSQSTPRVAAMFLHSIGPHYYNVVRELVAPSKPSTLSYGELKKILRKHLKAPPIIVAERRKLIKRDQMSSESIADYVVALKHLSLHCNYGDNLDENLRDRFISGLRSESTSLKLMEKARDKPALTFVEAVDFAQSREVTFAEARSMRDDMSNPVKSKTSVNAVRQNFKPRRGGQTGSGQCFRCGRSSHHPDQYWFKETKCNQVPSHRTHRKEVQLQRFHGQDRPQREQEFKPSGL